MTGISNYPIDIHNYDNDPRSPFYIEDSYLEDIGIVIDGDTATDDHDEYKRCSCGCGMWIRPWHKDCNDARDELERMIEEIR